MTAPDDTHAEADAACTAPDEKAADATAGEAAPLVVPDERFTKTVHLNFADVRAFARMAGDDNPLHHDADYAAQTRFKRPLACGGQLVAQMMGFLASHNAARGNVIGHDVQFRLHQPVFAEETIELAWQVEEVTAAPHLKGEVVMLRGQIRNEAGKVAISAKARILVGERL
jgi:3-hydroxybutyryl-CoA dehydratase